MWNLNIDKKIMNTGSSIIFMLYAYTVKENNVLSRGFELKVRCSNYKTLINTKVIVWWNCVCVWYHIFLIESMKIIRFNLEQLLRTKYQYRVLVFIYHTHSSIAFLSGHPCQVRTCWSLQYCSYQTETYSFHVHRWCLFIFCFLFEFMFAIKFSKVTVFPASRNCLFTLRYSEEKDDGIFFRVVG